MVALVARRSDQSPGTPCNNAVFIGDMNWDEATDGQVPLPPGWADAWLTHCKPRNAPVGPGKHVSRHVIQRTLNPCFASYVASYVVVSNICQALPRQCPPSHPTHFEPSFLTLNGIL